MKVDVDLQQENKTIQKCKEGGVSIEDVRTTGAIVRDSKFFGLFHFSAFTLIFNELPDPAVALAVIVRGSAQAAATRCGEAERACPRW